MATERPDPRPDLVLVLTDQQRADQLGFASGGHFATPNIDALAARGVIFENAYSAGTTCVPARVSMLTGVQPHRVPTQENAWALQEGFWTVARELAASGYETAAIGKMHFAPVHADHGFETLRLCEHIRSQALGPISHARGDVFDDYHHWLLAEGLDDWRYETDHPVNGPFRYPPDAHPTAWVERETSNFLARRDRTRPLFLVVSFPNPHAPYDPPEPYASMFDPRDSRLPSTGAEANAALPMAFGLATSSSSTRAEAENPDAVRRFLALVRGLVKQIDDAIGRIVHQLDVDSTVVMFTSDHGDFSGHRGLMRKNPWIPFDDLARVPFVAVAPDALGGRREPTVMQTSDVALTCLDYAGLTPPALDFDSRTLRPLLTGAPSDGDTDRSVYSAMSVGWPMVRHGRYKLIANDDRPGRVLFDVEADPDETTNLLLDPEYKAVRDDLEARLHEMIVKAPEVVA